MATPAAAASSPGATGRNEQPAGGPSASSATTSTTADSSPPAVDAVAVAAPAAAPPPAAAITASAVPRFNPNLFPSTTKSSKSVSIPLWEMDAESIERWAKSNHSLYPRKPHPPRADAKTATASAAAASSSSAAPPASDREQADYKHKVARSDKLVDNLIMALKSASDVTTTDDYGILDESFARGSEVRHTPGSVLTRLTVGGTVNALAGKKGGIVDVTTCRPLSNVGGGHDSGAAAVGSTVEPPSKKVKGTGTGLQDDDGSIATASNMTLHSVVRLARKFHTSVQSRVELDMIATTPSRIVDMLCPDLSFSEVNAIRRRIYDTVILGFGTKSSAAAAALEGGEDVPVSARSRVHDVEKFHKCKVCGNNDQSSFVMDRKNGDLICTDCGTVATESLMHEGSAYRKFEGEEDRNHHGDAPNPLFSDAYNTSTTLGGVSFQSGAGMGGYGSNRGARGIENVLRNAHAYTEMNISQFGKGEKKTRIGYKDRQKKDAFVQMNHVGDALNINESVIQRAKGLFAGFRDDRELVQQFKGVIAACLCEAFDQLSRDGRQLLRQRAGEDSASTKKSSDDDGSDDEGKAPINFRASRRNDLHGTSFAGRGGILIGASDKVKKEKNEEGNGDVAPVNGNGLSASERIEMKPASAWDLDDCRTWLLEASRSIAKQWVEQAKDEGAGSDIPKGSVDELEGRLVESTLKLIDDLESELKRGSSKTNASMPGRKTIVTPRAASMGSLGIKWQHSHERGSGGRGGVGNSGKSVLGKRSRPGGGGADRASGSGKSAGQLLTLKTSKKLASAIGDAVAGEAFHRELKALVGRQQACKKKSLRNEAARERFRQMQRKPWLQARAQL
mmetsp:Transcript_22492/g.48695  ORF Transcript_22492/g.48695 Transcript_22492/m.48695 type:complete len:848 (+) Transcript_22492:94-2637(+)